MSMDYDKLKKAVRLFIEGIGEDPDREGLIETPDRVAKMCEEICGGIDASPDEILSRQFKIEENSLVLEKDINFHSICEHHLLPFFGKVHIAYIPNGNVVGLSKLARCVEVFARRPQLQERLTSQIAESLERYVKAKGVMVVCEAEHMCMTMRGVKKPGSRTVTIAARGELNDPVIQANILNNINA